MLMDDFEEMEQMIQDESDVAALKSWTPSSSRTAAHAKAAMLNFSPPVQMYAQLWDIAFCLFVTWPEFIRKHYLT